MSKDNTLEWQKEPPKEMSPKLILDLRLHREKPWMLKITENQADALKEEVEEAFDKRKGDWLRKLAEGLIPRISYAPIPSDAFGYDNLDFSGALEVFCEAFMSLKNIDTDREPTQKSVIAE